MDKTSCFDFSFSWSWSRCTLWSWKVVIVIYSSCLESLLFRPCKQLSCKYRHNLDVDVCLMFMVMFICISPKIFRTKCVFYVKISSHPNRLFLKWIRNVALCNFMLPYSRRRKSDVQKQGKSWTISFPDKSRQRRSLISFILSVITQQISNYESWKFRLDLHTCSLFIPLVT